MEGQTHSCSDWIAGSGVNAAEGRGARPAPGFVIVLGFVEYFVGQVVHRKIKIHPAANLFDHAEVQDSEAGGSNAGVLSIQPVAVDVTKTQRPRKSAPGRQRQG